MDNQVAGWGDLVQGLHTWQTLVVENNQAGNALAIPIIDDYAKALAAVGKISMPLMITKYWGARQPSNGNIYYEWQGGQSMDGQWQAAITAGVPWVEIGTWNDPNESYMMPIDDFALYNPGAGVPAGWCKPAFGYAELLRYYIAWFRTGSKPAVRKDALFWFYRTHPATAKASGTAWSSPPGAVTRYVPSADGSGKIPADADQMYMTVFALADAKLEVGGTSHSLTAGINQVSVPFVAGPAPDMSVVRGSTTVLHGIGKDAILADPPYYDWWSSTGFVEQ